MVFQFNVNIPALTQEIWPEANRHSIWNRLGYCLVQRVPILPCQPSPETPRIDR
jgi:hypothetical protein